MRALSVAVLLLCSCSTVEDTCPPDDLECWAAHLEADLDGDPLSPSDEFTLSSSGGTPIQSGTSRALLWVVGADGKIARRANNEWTPQQSGTTATLRAVWAAAENDVWAGGDGDLLHFDGVSWTRVNAGLQRVDAISGSGSDDVWFFVASQGIVHFDGAGFSSIPLGVGDFTPSALYVAARGDVWVGAIDGSLAHGDGRSFTRVTSRTTNPIRGITALAAADVYFVADQLFRGDATRGFEGVMTSTAVSGLTAVHSAKGMVWAVSATRVVQGPRPDFEVTGSALQLSSVFFDGQTAFTPGLIGQVGRFERTGTDLGAEYVDSSARWLAVSGVIPPDPASSRVTISIDAGPAAGDGGIPLEPGVRTAIPITFEDGCGNRPGLCVGMCLRSSRCFIGPILCRPAFADQRIRGFATLYVKENARATGGKEPGLDLLVGPIPCAMPDAGLVDIKDTRRVPVTVRGPVGGGGGGGGGGSTGGGGGGAGGGGTATCAHCVEGQICSGCGNIGRRCGTTCCAPGETCMGNSFCARSATSGHSGPLFVLECGRDPDFTVQCGDGSCCGRCQTCSGDGRCLLP